MNSDKKWVTLNNGAKMPTIGMGTWHHGPREEIDAALRQEPLIHRLNLKIQKKIEKFVKRNSDSEFVVKSDELAISYNSKIGKKLTLL